jgi:hypothetical protein
MSLPASTVNSWENSVPVNVTSTLLPWMPPPGLTWDNVGGSRLFTVNITGPLVPLLVLTVTILAPGGALKTIANVAEPVVAESTLTLLTVMPLPASTVIPARNPVPVNATLTLLPWIPTVGFTWDNVGGSGPDVMRLTVIVSAPVFWAASTALIVRTFAPASRGRSLQIQTIVPVQVPLPPRLFVHVTEVTLPKTKHSGTATTQSDAPPPSTIGVVPVSNVGFKVGDLIVTVGARGSRVTVKVS